MPKRILVVDDERHIVRLVQMNLTQSGYSVEGASDGRQALEKIGLELPDLVILDVMMPEMDGFQVLDHLRKDPRTEHLPVVMLTAKSHDADVIQAWRGGADCYLTKPFSPAELIAIVQRMLEGGGPGGSVGGVAPA